MKFTALQDLSVAVFELHNDLRVTKVTDEKKQHLSAERVTQDSTIRVPLPSGLPKDSFHDVDLRIRRPAGECR